MEKTIQSYLSTDSKTLPTVVAYCDISPEKLFIESC